LLPGLENVLPQGLGEGKLPGIAVLSEAFCLERRFSNSRNIDFS